MVVNENVPRLHVWVPVFVAGIFCMTAAAGGNDTIPDAALNIPKEDGYDELEQVTMEDLAAVKLYDRYPESWQVINLTDSWKVGTLKQLQSQKGTDAETGPILTGDPGAGQTHDDLADNDLLEEVPVDLQAHTETKTKKTVTVAFVDLTDQAAWTEITKVHANGLLWQIGRRSQDNRPLGSGTHLFVNSFDLPNGLDAARQSCVVHFRRSLFDGIYVNGRKAFGRGNSFAAFTGDISQFVKQGENIICMPITFRLQDKTLAKRELVNPYRETEVLITPVTYVQRMLISTDTTENRLRLDLLINNNAKTADREIVAKINSYGDEQVVFEARKSVRLRTGQTTVQWTMTWPDPVRWSPDNPHLYELQIYDANENVLGKERFGFRDFVIRNGHFHLNGKRIKLFGTCGGIDRVRGLDIAVHPGEYYVNTELKRRYYAYLKAAKLAGLTTLLDYGSRTNLGRGAYEACDELGILFYATLPAWGGMVDPAVDDLEKHMLPMNTVCKDCLYNFYNHPCLVMFSFGAELYGARPQNLKFAYDRFKPLDNQQRPVCSSSGRIKIALNRAEKDTTDFADDHSYWGTLKGPWLWNRGYFRKLRQDVDKCYGQSVKPLTSFETLDSDWRYDCYENASNVVRAFAGNSVDKAGYVNTMNDFTERGDGTATVRLVLAHGQGSRRHYIDEVYAHNSFALLWQRVFEIFRQEGDLDGWGAFHVAKNCLMYADNNGNTLAALQKRYPDANIERTAIDIGRKAFVKLPQYYMLKRCYNPELISGRWFDRNLIAGSGSVKTQVYAINDSGQKHSYKAWVLFRNGDSKTIHKQILDFGTVDSFGKKTIEFTYRIPSELSTGYYRLELYLFEGNRRVSDNYYPVYVVNRKDGQYRATTNKKVAFYSFADPGADLATTKPVLDSMALKYEKITTFDNLDGYQVLIIGANSMNNHVVAHGERIRAWVERGGRLLCFEQNREGYIPWLPEMKIEKAIPTSAADIVDRTHPLFTGLTQENFDTWSGTDGSLYHRVLAPLNNSVVAAAAAGYVLRHEGYVKSTVSDVALGRGISVMNQFDVTGRYGEDAVATIVANNLVRHILSDDTDHSWRISSARKVLRFLDEDACTSIDFEPYCNARLTDEQPADGKGGWNDRGAHSDFRSLPVGDQALEGVPFNIIDADAALTGNNCIMLKMKGLPWSELEVTGIQVNRAFHSLHFLHTGLGHTPVSYTLVVHYEDGKQQRQQMKTGVHIDSWIAPRPLPQAAVVWRGSCPDYRAIGAYHTEWTNPWPLKKITAIDFVGTAESGAVIIAVTGYTVIGEEGWEDKELQKRKKVQDPL